MRGPGTIGLLLAVLAMGCQGGTHEKGRYCLQRNESAPVLVLECFERQATCARFGGDDTSCVFRRASEKPWCVDAPEVSARCYLTEDLCETQTGKACLQRWTPKPIGLPE